MHNVSAIDVRFVLEHLVKCELIEYVKQGLKTSRRSTNVYIKQLPICQHDGEIDDEQKIVFGEKLKEFNSHHAELTINEYLKKNTVIALDATGIATDDLVNYFSLPEYMKIELSPLYSLKETGDLFC